MRLSFLTLLACVAPCAMAAASAAPSYSVVGSIAGPDGPWDYARVDAESHRLYVARSASVTVADLGPDGKVTSWGELARGHAVLPLPGNRLLVTSGNDATVRFFDTISGRQIASIAAGKKADAAIYDAPHHRAIVMNSASGTISLIDTVAMAVTGTITVKPGLEYAALAKDDTLFVNNENANEMEVIDVSRRAAGKAIALPGCEGPTGLGYDGQRNRLIASCGNGKAAIVDAASRKQVGLVDIGKGADAVIMDDVRGLAFIPCGEDGVLDILSFRGRGGVTRVGRVTTELGARTGALDPSTGAIYLPTAKFAPPATVGGRSTIVPGSFHILVIKPA